ncbi:hypothetical protein D3C78_1682810 [compost metagenome]
MERCPVGLLRGLPVVGTRSSPVLEVVDVKLASGEAGDIVSVLMRGFRGFYYL